MVRKTLAVFAALAMGLSITGVASAAPAHKSLKFIAGCDSGTRVIALHEAGHLADMTETASRCWGPGGLLKSSSVHYKIDNTPAGSDSPRFNAQTNGSKDRFFWTDLKRTNSHSTISGKPGAGGLKETVVPE
jgi:hypothetical protein